MQYWKFYVNSKQLEKVKPSLKGYSIGFGKSATTYIALPFSFDIETTNYIDYDANIKESYMWVWQVGIGNDEVYGRTWEEFERFIDYIIEATEAREKCRLLCWVANLGFEFQFIRKHFTITEMFAKEERRPLKFLLNGAIEFRDALAISGGSLDFLAKSYTKTQKMKGNLNYSIPRNSKTPIHSDEFQYIRNDVRILTEFATYIFDTYGRTRRIPLTKTGILRNIVKERARKFSKEKYGKHGFEHLKLFVKNLFPENKEKYLFIMQYLFRGGFTHAQNMYVDRLITSDDMGGVDFTSSYPYVMLHGYVPVTPFVRIECNTYEQLKNLCNTHCVIFIATFNNLKHTSNHSIESKSKCIELEGATIDNGRVWDADKMRVFLTELDLFNYEKFYTYESIDIEYVAIAERGKLPQYLLEPLVEAYTKKTELKHNGLSRTREYAIQKSVVNSAYGLTVTRINFKNISYEDGWTSKPTDKTYDDEISNQILSPYWGIYITARARYNELQSLWVMRDDVVYSDTDSHKVLNFSKHKPFIEYYNNYVMDENRAYCEKYGYDYSTLYDLGTFDFEGYVKRFTTCGAKRYIYEDIDGVHTTISGLPKKALTDYSKAIGVDVFDIFKNEMEIPKEYSQKLTTHYRDEETERIIEDIEGNFEKMSERSSVALYQIPFSMSMEKDYLKLLAIIIERMRLYGN